MPKGHTPKRESKKPKKKDSRKAVEVLPPIVPTEVEVVGKRKKSREEEEF